jgi:hypothetical protein
MIEGKQITPYVNEIQRTAEVSTSHFPGGVKIEGGRHFDQMLMPTPRSNSAHQSSKDASYYYILPVNNLATAILER